MKSTLKKSDLSSSIIEEVDEFFPPPPWLNKADDRDFRSLRQRIITAIEPENFLEAVYGNEMAHLIMQIRDNQRQISCIMASAQEEAIMRLLSGRCEDLSSLIEGVQRREDEAMKKISSLLKDFGFTQADIDAQSRSIMRDEITRLERDSDFKRDQFDRLVQNFEKRRLIISERLRRSQDPMINQALSISHEKEKDQD